MGITCKTHTYWNPQTATEVATEIGMERLKLAAYYLAEKTRSNLDSIIKHATSRPEYKTGKDKGKWWTARDAGELKHSVRVKPSDKGERNVWVIVGSKKAYYAPMFEYATHITKGKGEGYRGEPFFRPAIASSKAAMKAIVQRGI